ncbi:MAG: GGDEF domain-containing protein [Acidobacteriota bacterium]
MDVTSLFIGIILILILIIAAILYMWYRENSKSRQELNNAYKTMEKLSKFDPLTQLSNKNSMTDRIEIEMIRMGRTWRPFCLVMLVVDNFRQINDKFGRDSGNKILESLGLILTKTLRRQDTASRWEGEEFLILLPETTLDGGYTIAEKIRKAVESTKVTYGDYVMAFTITLGVDIYNKLGPANYTIRKAEAALYEGIKRGRNTAIRSDDPGLDITEYTGANDISAKEKL